MLNQIHFLLTYSCNFECDHCFLYCSPRAEGTFNLEQIRKVLHDSRKLESMEWVYFEGGEPFLHYPLMVEGLRLAKEAGFKTGVVTNCYWATGEEEAMLWLRPIVEAGIDDLSLSDDVFHHGEQEDGPAKKAARAAEKLGLSSMSICIESPTVTPATEDKGAPVIGGGAVFRGRAVEMLTEGLPTKPRDGFTECTREELEEPGRVHIDPFGNVMPCQGVSIGNFLERPLHQIISEYDAHAHPICGPLLKGGPVELAKTYGIELEGEFIEECHYCYLVRKALIEKFPEELAPKQVFGL